MLSPQLLGILRTYWRLARPRLYLFPGRDEDHPIDPTVLHAACRSAAKAAGLTKRVTLHTLRHSRDPSLGEWNRHQDYSGSARPQQSVVDGALYAGRHPYDKGDAEPARSSVAGSDAARVRRRWDAGSWPAPAFIRTGPSSRSPISCASTVRTRSRRASGACRAARDERHHGVPDGNPRRPCRGLRRLRRHADRLQLLPQSSLSEVSGTKWLTDRQAELLPVPYFHLVFTLPAPIAEIAFQNKTIVYTILFKAAADAMTALAANPRRLGAKIGGLAVLHTWGQALTHHPHVHCVVPGGGLSSDGTRWVAARPSFFLAIKPLSRLFRRLFLERLQAAFDARMLGFYTNLTHLFDRNAFAAHVQAMRRIDWLVYAKKPFGGPARFSPISAATPIVSQSPTAASKLSMTITSPSLGRTTARMAPRRSCG